MSSIGLFITICYFQILHIFTILILSEFTPHVQVENFTFDQRPLILRLSRQQSSIYLSMPLRFFQ